MGLYERWLGTDKAKLAKIGKCKFDGWWCTNEKSPEQFRACIGTEECRHFENVDEKQEN